MSTIQSQTTLIHADSGLTAAAVTQRNALESAFTSNSISVTTTPETLALGDVVTPRQVLLKLLNGDNLKVSVNGGTDYTLILASPGDSMLLGLESRTVSAITAVADVAGNLGGTYLTLNDLNGEVWVWIDTGNGDGVKATGLLTGSATVNVVAGATVTLGSKTYTYRQLYAVNTLTSDGTIPANGDTVTIGSTVYTAKTTITAAAGDVLIGGSAAAFLTNLYYAINGGGVPGTNYSSATLVNTQVSATNPTATTLVATAIIGGTSQNSLATTETSAHLSWPSTTLGGGGATAPATGATVEGEVCIGLTPDASLLNLVYAIRHEGTPGTDYFCAAAHPQVTCDAFVTSNSFNITALSVGTTANAYATTETSATLAFGGSTLSGGVNSSLAPTITTQRLLSAVIAPGATANAVADAVAATLDADVSFLCPNPAAATLAITDAEPGPRTAITAGTTGFTSPGAVFTPPASIYLKSLSTSQVVVAISPA